MDATTKADPNLLRPLVLKGPAVERDRRVLDKNDSTKSVEKEWLANARAQDAEISESENEFLAELNRRATSAKSG